MTELSLVTAPNAIFKTKCEPVAAVTDETRSLVDGMFKVLEEEHAVGLGANMVGLSKRIAIVDLHESGVSKPYTFINPVITWRSDETQTFEEASLSFPGISANITRPRAIKLSFLDYNGVPQELEAEGYFATVIQHEVDYLEGKVYLDYLSPLKRDMLMKKMQKFIKQNHVHVHTDACRH